MGRNAPASPKSPPSITAVNHTPCLICLLPYARMAISNGKITPGVYMEYAFVRRPMISLFPLIANTVETIPITPTVILTNATLSLPSMSFTNMLDALTIQVSVEDKIADRSPNTSIIPTNFGTIPITYIRALLLQSSSEVTLYLTNIPIIVMTKAKTNNDIPAMRAESLAVFSSLEIKFLDIISGPKKYTPPMTKN